ncbi:hypothetical protein Tco_0652951 [Tanacetum coccineum]|uniref:Reverse transcriptase domain-containing protein n=1 Tax=Tanacetum coccineum TaxID=301880 RepID=A0ABQ4WZ23_9ASTR
MLDERRLGEVIPIFKNKGDVQVCSNHMGIKLLERRLRRETRVCENQFGFIPGRSSVEAIHLIRSLMEKYKERQGDLHMAFLDLEKLSRGIQEDIPWCLMFADDIVLVSESGNFYRVAIRPDMLYGSECWPITKALANRMEVEKLRMLRRTCGKIIRDMISNGVFRAELGVETIVNKMREGRLRRRGRPKLRWEDRVKHDMKELLLSKDMTSDRDEWRARIRLGG